MYDNFSSATNFVSRDFLSNFSFYSAPSRISSRANPSTPSAIPHLSVFMAHFRLIFFILRQPLKMLLLSNHYGILYLYTFRNLYDVAVVNDNEVIKRRRENKKSQLSIFFFFCHRNSSASKYSIYCISCSPRQNGDSGE